MKPILFLLLLISVPASAQSVAKLDMIAMLNEIPAPPASVSDAHNKASCTATACNADNLFAAFDANWNTFINQNTNALADQYRQIEAAANAGTVANVSTPAPSGTVPPAALTQQAISATTALSSLKLSSPDIMTRIDSIVYVAPGLVAAAIVNHDQPLNSLLQHQSSGTDVKGDQAIRLQYLTKEIADINSQLSLLRTAFQNDKSVLNTILAPFNSALKQSGYGANFNPVTDLAQAQSRGIGAEQSIEGALKRVYSETAFLIVQQTQLQNQK